MPDMYSSLWWIIYTLCIYLIDWLWFGLMVFNATFNNISTISLRSVLFVEETGVPGENHQPAVSHWQTLPHNVASNTPHHERNFNSQLLWWYALLLTYVVVNPSIIRSKPWQPLLFLQYVAFVLTDFASTTVSFININLLYVIQVYSYH